MGCCGPAMGHTVVARGWQCRDRRVVPLWGREWGKRWGGMGLGRQRVLRPHPTESFRTLQGSAGQVRAQGRSREVRLRLPGCASLGVTQGAG